MPQAWSFRARCAGVVYRTPDYAFCTSIDQYHGTGTSHAGWHAHTTEPATTEWLGNNLRRSLLTCRHFHYEEQDFDRQAWRHYHERSVEVYNGLLHDLALTYGYRSGKAAMAKALSVLVSYPRDGLDPIKLLATNRKRGGVWDAIANSSDDPAVVRMVPFGATDEELGSAVRGMLAVSTLSGERVEQNAV